MATPAVRDIDLGYRRVMRRLKTLQAVELTVGYHEGTMHAAGKKLIPTAQIAAKMEYGDRRHNVPPRPTLGPSMDRSARLRVKRVRPRITGYLAGRRTLIGALGVTGAELSGDVKKAITRLKRPPLKQSTIEARARRNAPIGTLRKKSGKGLSKKALAKAGGTNPLVDTGAMRGDVDWQIRRKRGLFGTSKL